MVTLLVKWQWSTCLIGWLWAVNLIMHISSYCSTWRIVGARWSSFLPVSDGSIGFPHRLGMSHYEVIWQKRLIGISSPRILEVTLHESLVFFRAVLYATWWVAEFSVLICFVFKISGDAINKKKYQRNKCLQVSDQSQPLTLRLSKLKPMRA